MRLFYNLLQLLLSPIILAIVPFYLMTRPEKLPALSARLGFNLDLPGNLKPPVIWIHALSVGEVTSALPLVKQLHRTKKDTATLVFSASTVSGHLLAEQLLRPHVDAVIFFPFDIAPVVHKFLRRIKPDLFILIETDFWPNFLLSLSAQSIPALLFNGRVSVESMRHYQRFGFFFKPLFNQFRFLCMQTESDSENMKNLGIAAEKIKTIGNLKFAAASEPFTKTPSAPSPFPGGKLVVLAGSTHAGEEELLLRAYLRLMTAYPNLHLAIAPRDIKRSSQIVELAQSSNLRVCLYSLNSSEECDVTVIDTIGDLSTLYMFAEISFIGGSLVDEGGHNPLEAARGGSALIFGCHMEDFSEISAELVEANAALMVDDEFTCIDALEKILGSHYLRQTLGRNAQSYVDSKSQVTAKHMEVIEQYL